MFKTIRYAIAITKIVATASKKLMAKKEPLEVFKDTIGDIFETRCAIWPKKTQAEVMEHAHFSGKMIIVIEKARSILKSEELAIFLEGAGESARKQMVDNIALATEMETVGPRQAAINYVTRRIGKSVETNTIMFVQAMEKARLEKLERLRQADLEIPDDEIQINDEELDN